MFVPGPAGHDRAGDDVLGTGRALEFAAAGGHHQRDECERDAEGEHDLAQGAARPLVVQNGTKYRAAK